MGVELLDFKELSQDGQDFELLIRELIFRQGYSVHWSGKGADGGRDLIAVEKRGSFFLADDRRWLIQCKHNARSGKSVGIADLDDITDSCAQHECNGYLLACSTYPSSTVVNRLERITANRQSPIVATHWDAVKIERLLTTPKNWALAQRFFPISASSEDWQIYATGMPNHWVVIYKGYYFHLRNRVGSNRNHHLQSIKNRINDIESIQLPEKHFLRPRSIHYDDKNGGYEWYVDYMYPNDQRPVIGSAQIADHLGNGYALEDGQFYIFHVKLRSYLEHSDHYDPDHYDYYGSDAIPVAGGPRNFDSYESYEEAENSKAELEREIEREKNRGFDQLCEALDALPFIRMVRKCNAQIEYLDRFHIQKNWSEIIENLEIDSDRFFSAWFLISVEDDREFHSLVSQFHQGVEKHFRLTRAYSYAPSDVKGSVLDDDELLYELTLSIHPSCIGNKASGRSLLNEYFIELAEKVSSYQNES